MADTPDSGSGENYSHVSSTLISPTNIYLLTNYNDLWYNNIGYTKGVWRNGRRAWLRAK